jgi:hypothetical protein
LLSAGEGINLIFSHHRPQEFDAETKALLTASGHGPVVMFTGHTHEHHLDKHEGSNGQVYYELNTGAVLEFPQIGRLIELRGTPQGAVWLVSRALWSNLMAVVEMPTNASTIGKPNGRIWPKPFNAVTTGRSMIIGTRKSMSGAGRRHFPKAGRMPM